MPSFSRPRHDPERGFTQIELLVAVAILLLLSVVLAGFVGLVGGSWKTHSADPYADAENAFEDLTANLSTATLESYPDYADASGGFRLSASSAFTPDHLARRSDLAFAGGPCSGTVGLLAASHRTVAGCGVFFVAPRGQTRALFPTGSDQLLNAIGYFVEFGDEDAAPAFFQAYHRWRWRLKQVLQPSEQLQVYTTTSSSAWITALTAPGLVVPALAENVVALAILPERAASDSGAALSPHYAYDSRDTSNPVTLHQLPPRVRLALVAIDSPSADRLAAVNGIQPPALVSPAYFQQAASFAQDVASLDADLTRERIGHRIFEREIELRSAAWSNTP